MLTSEHLQAIMPLLPAAKRAALFPFLTSASAEFGIEPAARTAAFLAQLAHESAQFRFMEEIWGPTPAQRRYEPPGKLASDLGNTEPGDGHRFKGRGPIQITGRANYQRFGGLLGLDLLADPARAALPEVAFRIAGLFWSKKGLNELADQVSDEAFKEITRRINGGFNGLAERQRYYEAAKAVLGVTGPSVTRGSAPARTEEKEPDFGRGHEAIRTHAARRRGSRNATPASPARKRAIPARAKKTALKKPKKGSPTKKITRKTTGKKTIQKKTAKKKIGSPRRRLP